jgi:hypothetical protein
MNIDIDDAILRLNPESNFQLHDARGACVHVHWGDLWITQEGDIKDHVIKSGESFAVSKSGMTFLAAMSEAGVSVMEKCRGSEVASAAAISAATLPATQQAASISARRHEDAVEDSSLGGSQLSNPLPGVEELDQRMARAESLRAQYFEDAIHYFADAAMRVWISLRRSAGVLREFG